MVKIKVYKFSYTAGKNINDTALWKTLWQWVEKFKMRTPYNLSNSSSRFINPRETPVDGQKKTSKDI